MYGRLPALVRRIDICTPIYQQLRCRDMQIQRRVVQGRFSALIPRMNIGTILKEKFDLRMPAVQCGKMQRCVAVHVADTHIYVPGN